MIEKSFDLAIIGSGPGGYIAAIKAAQLKKESGTNPQVYYVVRGGDY